MIRLYAYVAVLFAMHACGLEIEQLPVNESDGPEKVTVALLPEVSASTRSSIAPDESAIKDINVYAFRGGMLVSEVYTEDLDAVVMELPVGYAYNIYAVANMGRRIAVAEEAAFASFLKYSISETADLDGYIPMSCFCEDVNVRRSTRSISLTLGRLVAKLVLSIDKASLLEGLKVRSVRLCQSASVVRPFKWNGQGGSRVQRAGDTVDGDYASPADLEHINSGGEVVFYALENCQGVLLPGNKSPYLKVPSLLGGKDKLCTYFEIECTFDGSGLLGGEVRYRVYAGLDDCTSFDVPGNSCINVKLSLTGEGLHKVSWKVDADVHVMDGYAAGKVLDGMHAMSGLYVGEKLLYQVVLSDQLMEYIGGDVSGCTLKFVGVDGTSSGLNTETLATDGNIINAEISCTSEVSGELHLYSPDGSPIACLEKNMKVNKPGLVLAEYSSWLLDEPVEKLAYIPECDVNGDDEILYLYFIDKDGYNLNGCSSYGFDPDLFSLLDGVTGIGGVAVENLKATFHKLPQAKGAAASQVNLSCDNDGSSHDVNLLLAEVYAGENKMCKTITEENFGLCADMEAGIGVLPVELSLVDNGWAKYHDTQLSMMVDNPSNLPLEVSVWQLVSTYSSTGPTYSDYVENNLQIDKIQFITGAYYNGDPLFYGSFSGFCSERNDNGDTALSRDGILIYPLAGISTDDILKAASYGGCGNGQMIHMVDVRMAGCSLRSEDAVLHDNVSNGSATYDYIYYDDGAWNYKGASLFTDGTFVSSSGDWRYKYPDVMPLTLDRMYSRYMESGPSCVEFLYAPDYGNLSVMTYTGHGSQYGLTLSFEYSGTMNGFVQTYPSGTWFGAENNKCHVDFSHSKSGVPLKEGGQFIWADDGQLKQAMDAIYEFSYKDSQRPLGADSFMHRAHPTDVALDIGIMVEGDAGRELYPFYVNWEEDYLEYYHQQDEVTYKCALDASVQGYSMAVVTPKK